MPQRMGAERGERPPRVGHVGIMPASNLGEDEANRPGREAAMPPTRSHGGRGEKQRGRLRRGIRGALALQILREGLPGVGREKHGAFGFPFAGHPDETGAVHRA